MASFKLNLAVLDNCPDAATLATAIDNYGTPEDEEFGVLACTSSSEAVYATILRKSNQAIQKFDPETGEVATTAVEKATVYPIGIFPQRSMLEMYDGSASGIDQIANFFASNLALPTIVNQIPCDIPAAMDKLKANVARFQLRSIRISEYAHNSYMLGPYSPKFFESEQGCEFLAEHVDYVTQANVSFQGPHGRVTVTLTPNSCFRYSIANEDDKPVVQSVLRKLI